MKRGGCVGCFYKSVKSYIAMALLNPDEFAIVEKLENELNESGNKQRKTFFRILGDCTRPSMKEIRIMAHEELFKPEDVYAVVNDATPCGVFCNR